MPEHGKTTSETLESYSVSIPENNLPKTFQEFIGIARSLDVRYVWIDSLCIVQDSLDDWEKEAAQMASIYSNAYLTIAASGSSDGAGGCHVMQNVRSYGPVDIDCKVEKPSSPSSTEDSAQLFRLWSRDTYPIGQILSSDPLSKRGWTLQERELSPRVVHYSRDTIRWECRQLRATIEYPWGDGGSFDLGRLFDGRNNSKEIDDVTKQRLSWFELVDRYTKRSLTKQPDILPAFSGMARHIAESSSDEYAAGLWKSYFAHCLLWASNWHVGSGFKHHSRSPTYLAPSWSWASIKGPIHYLSWINGYWYTFNANPEPQYIPKVIDISLQASSDAYGSLVSGWVKIEGKVAVGFTRQEAYAKSMDHLNVSFTPGHQDRLDLYGASTAKTVGKVGEIRYDIPLCSDCAPVGTQRILWLLCCMNSKKSSDGKMKTFGIALESDDGDGTLSATTVAPTRFRRVGIVWGIDPSFWDRSVTSTITIV
jgi:hypothetical protein